MVKSQPKPVPPIQTYPDWRRVPSENWRWPNFSPQEIACRGTGKVKIVAAAMDKLQHLRTILGKPLILNSAYRSPEHNKKVGGVANSRHLEGDAFDVSMSNQDPIAFVKAAREAGFTGIGYYFKQNFIHIDCSRAREWNLDDKSKMLVVRNESPTPVFTPEPEKTPIPSILAKPEVLVPIGTAIGSSGLAPVLASESPVAWAVGAVIILLVAVGIGVYFYKRKEQKNILVG